MLDKRTRLVRLERVKDGVRRAVTGKTGDRPAGGSRAIARFHGVLFCWSPVPFFFCLRPWPPARAGGSPVGRGGAGRDRKAGDGVTRWPSQIVHAVPLAVGVAAGGPALHDSIFFSGAVFQWPVFPCFLHDHRSAQA